MLGLPLPPPPLAALGESAKSDEADGEGGAAEEATAPRRNCNSSRAPGWRGCRRATGPSTLL